MEPGAPRSDPEARALAEKDAEIARLSSELSLKEVLVEEMGRVLEAQAQGLAKLEARIERLEAALTNPPREQGF